MSTYAIGDIQGCYSALRRLTDLIHFDPSRDRLWFVGDLVNRGVESLAVLRFIKGLGPAAVTVLGNHDLHLLAVAGGVLAPHPKDTFRDVLAAPDRDELLAWLRRLPLVHAEPGYLLFHAGLLPQWTVAQVPALGRDVESVLQSEGYTDFLTYLYRIGYITDDGSRRWSEGLTGFDRLGVITNALTKLRVCSADGEMELRHKGPPADAAPGFMPWFEAPGRRSAEATVVFGHWAALGLLLRDKVMALDSGCVYGRVLTAVRLDDRQVFQVAGP